MGGRALGNGDSAQRDHHDRHNRPGFTDGLRFIQFSYALPIAMIVLSVTLVPFFYKSVSTPPMNISSGGSTRNPLPHQPAVSRFAWHVVRRRCLRTGRGAVSGPWLGSHRYDTGDYDTSGGLHDVWWRSGSHLDRRQVYVPIVFGLFAVIVAAVMGFPEGVGLADGFSIAAATGRLKALDLSLI